MRIISCRLNCKSTLVLTLIVLLVSFLPVSAIEYQVGVKIGDWMKYGDITLTGQVPAQMNVTWIKIEVTNVEGTTVTAQVTYHHPDGTETNRTQSTDITTGSGELGAFVIPKNLKKGDSFPAGTLGTITIEDEDDMVVAGAIRMIVSVEDFSLPGAGRFDLWWDQLTGVLMAANLVISSPPYSVSMTATETNLWGAGPATGPAVNLFYILIAIVIIVVVVGVGAILMLRKRRIQQMEATEP